MKNKIIFLILISFILVTSCSHTPPRKRVGIKRPARTAVKSDQSKKHGSMTSSDTAKSDSPPAIGIHDAHVTTLKTVKRDLEAFWLFARQMRIHNEINDLALLEEAAGEYLKESVDGVIQEEPEQTQPETIRLLAELHYLKAMLLYEFNNVSSACGALKDMKSRFSEHLEIKVDNADSGQITLDNIIKKYADKCTVNTVSSNNRLRKTK
jgi:hypothetical protein